MTEMGWMAHAIFADSRNSLSENRWWNNPSYFPASEYYGFEPKVLPVGVLLCGARRKACKGFGKSVPPQSSFPAQEKHLLASAWWGADGFYEVRVAKSGAGVELQE
jgi:hypothetical protein